MHTIYKKHENIQKYTNKLTRFGQPDHDATPLATSYTDEGGVGHSTRVHPSSYISMEYLRFPHWGAAQ